ncbi:MAG: site-2 protease family protein [Candidatus Nanoarchaeia archaeon]|nr:site-2 protease family protein [Candidatus Nanoarchaeia archaeon]
MNGNVHIGKLFGIKINLHYTWFLVFFLLAWALSSGYFPERLPGKEAYVYGILGALASLLLFASVLLHELSHSLVALKNKIKVSSITLFFFGGVAQVNEDNFTPNKELKVAIAGPIMSLFLGGLFFALSKFSGVYIGAVFGYLAFVNLILGGFNLVPGFPLDGGRVLRAILWKKWGDINRATYVAAEGGKMFAIFLIIIGVLGIFFGRIDLWYILLGLFLYSIAKNSYKQTVVSNILKESKVKEYMQTKYKALDASMPVSGFDFKKLMSYDQWVYPVLSGKKVIGVALQQQIEKAKAADGTRKILEVTIPIHKIKSVSPEDTCIKAYELMIMQRIELLPVIANGKVAGVIKAATLNELFSMAAVKADAENKAKRKIKQ